LSCWWLVNIRRYCSMPAFICYLCPSTLGWNAVHNCQSIPKQSHRLFQKAAANCGPLSDMLVFGRPCNLTTSHRNSLTSPRGSMVVRYGFNCLIFDSQSTTTQTASNNSYSGRPVTKSIDMSCHGFCERERGRKIRKLTCLLFRDLLHSAQFHAYHSTCRLIVFQ
jgi:hypothetical protein